VEAAHIDNAVLLDYLSSEVALDDPEIRITEPIVLIHNNCPNDNLHFGMPRDSKDFQDAGNESDKRKASATASRQQQLRTVVEWFNLETSDDNWDGGEAGNDADEVKVASEADDGSTQNVADWGHGTSSNVDGYDGEDGDDLYEEEEASPADDGSTQAVQD